MCAVMFGDIEYTEFELSSSSDFDEDGLIKTSVKNDDSTIKTCFAQEIQVRPRYAQL